MCGRYTLTTDEQLLADLGIDGPEGFVPRFNIAPTQPVPIVANRAERAFEYARWGLVPHWAKDVSIGARMINARAETLAEKPAFRDAFARRRCLVPADGFFEWKRDGRKKRPFWYHRIDRAAFAFAGLWDRWKQPDDEWLISCTIVTGPPNDLIADLHDRMPVIVGPEDYERWLHPDPLPPDALEDILHMPPAEGFEIYEVSTLVNKVDNDEPACVDKYLPVQTSLF